MVTSSKGLLEGIFLGNKVTWPIITQNKFNPCWGCVGTRHGVPLLPVNTTQRRSWRIYPSDKLRMLFIASGSSLMLVFLLLTT